MEYEGNLNHTDDMMLVYCLCYDDRNINIP